MAFNDLREFIEAARRLGQVRDIHGADWNLEIGALTELFAFRDPSPLLVFDQIPEHAPNFRVVSNLLNNAVRSGLTVGMPPRFNPDSAVDRKIHGARDVNRSAQLTTKPGVAKAQNRIV